MLVVVAFATNVKLPKVTNVNNKLLKILPVIQKELTDGSIIIIEEKRIRIRKLPITIIYPNYFWNYLLSRPKEKRKLKKMN